MGVVTKMNWNDFKVDLGELKNDKMRNFRERIWYIKFWANYVNSHSVKEWSEGPGKFLDAQFEKSGQFYKNLGKTGEGRRILRRLREGKIKKV